MALATFVTLHVYKGKPPTNLTPRKEAVGFDENKVNTMELESNSAYASARAVGFDENKVNTMELESNSAYASARAVSEDYI